MATNEVPVTLDDALDSFDVVDCGMLDNMPDLLEGWWAVIGPDGIIAYFGDEHAANGFRLSEVNRMLNG